MKFVFIVCTYSFLYQVFSLSGWVYPLLAYLFNQSRQLKNLSIYQKMDKKKSYADRNVELDEKVLIQVLLGKILLEMMDEVVKLSD